MAATAWSSSRRPAAGPACSAVEAAESPAVHLYRALQEFALSGDTSRAENLTLKRDRVVMTFNGTFYFESPIQNRVYGAVFVGEGTFHADPPPTDFERENVRRLLNADSVDSDFRAACYLRVTAMRNSTNLPPGITFSRAP